MTSATIPHRPVEVFFARLSRNPVSALDRLSVIDFTRMKGMYET